ncbi:41683_t:CDS:2 [Gigaspora margarita]|uniref:41683_t:CDS:1 n=1 Tax=Gigaspora margarita TaxID=4874 RepID=A0ABN7UTP7_GIGMA|nr:41683_t:CDS:2 [Gigaspora margarita]
MSTINFMNSRIQTQRFTNNTMTDNTINQQVKILFRNKDFLVVDKPYDIRIDGDTSKAPTVSSLLYAQDPTLPTPLRNVHQLDHATSGCYCLALSKKAAGIASVAFAKRKVEKTYSAIVRGWMSQDNYIIDQQIAQVPNNRYRMCIGTPENPGKPAKTKLEVIRRGYFYPTSSSLPSGSPIKVTLINLYPITGRRHQLRLHCQYLGHPIVGDWHYESQIMEYTDTFRMMLHACKLRIPLNIIQDIKFGSADNINENVKNDNLEDLNELDVVSEDPFPGLVYECVKDET